MSTRNPGVLPGLRILVRMLPLILAGNLVYFVASILASRLLSESDYSVLATQLAALSVLGTGAAGVQLDVAANVVNVSDDPGPSSIAYWFRTVLLSVSLSFAVLAALPYLASFWDLELQQILWFVLGPAIVIQSSFVQGQMQGRRLFGYFYAFVALLGVWRISSLAVGWTIDLSIGSLIGMMNVGSLTIAYAFLALSGGVGMTRAQFLSPELLRFSLGSMAINALLYADVFLARAVGDGELGGFLAASTLVKALLVFPVLLTQIFFPDFATRASESGLKAKVARQLLLLVTGVTVAGAVGFYSLAHVAVPLVYGSERVVSRGTAFWLAVYIVPSALLLVVVNVLLAHKSRKVATVLVVWCAMHFVTIPLLAESIRDVAIATACSLIGALIALVWCEYRFLSGAEHRSPAVVASG